MKKRRFEFTRAALVKLECPKEGRTYYYDANQDGLALEVSGETMSFRVYKKFHGRPLKITLGHFDSLIPETRQLPEGTKPIDLLRQKPRLNVRMARKVAVAVLAELGAGVNPSESHARKRLTLGEVFTHYRTSLINERKKTVAGVTWYWERYIGALPDEPRKKHGKERKKAPGAVNWEYRGISDITREEVSRLRFNLTEKVGETSANRVIELLRAVFNYAIKERLFNGENPAASVGKNRLEARERFLRPEESERFFKALDSEVDRDFADYVLLSLYTGARRGNVLRMRWEELSLEGNAWTVSGQKMKNGEPMTFPLVKEAIEILGQREKAAKPKEDGEEPSEWVFPGDTPEGHHGPFRAQWRRFVKETKLRDLRVHDLRRSLGSWMAANGASTAVTMRALGHKSINAALIYQRLALAPVRDAMQGAVSAMLTPKKGENEQETKEPTRSRG